MELLANLITRALSRDLIYVMGGLIVLASTNRLPGLSYALLSNSIFPEPINYVLVAGLAYLVAYSVTELFSIFGITINHEWWFPRKNRFGRLISWIHKRTHGMSLIEPHEIDGNAILEFFEKNNSEKDFWSFILMPPYQHAITVIRTLNALSNDRRYLRHVLYPYYVQNFDAKIERKYWMKRLTWLRFFSAIGGSCLITAGFAILTRDLLSCDWKSIDWPAPLIVGSFAAVHAYYRSAQLTLIRLANAARVIGDATNRISKDGLSPIA